MAAPLIARKVYIMSKTLFQTPDSNSGFYCVLEDDSTISFGYVDYRQGGDTLSNQFCNIEERGLDGRLHSRIATAEEYRSLVVRALSHYERTDLPFYNRICDNMEPAHKDFLNGAAFEYKAYAYAEQQKQQAQLYQAQRVARYAALPPNYSDMPVAAVYNYVTKELKTK